MSFPTGWELILLLGVLVLLFGATKLPTAARAIGQSMRIFKAETKGMRSEDEATQQPPPPPSSSPPLPPSGQVGTGPQETRVEEPHRRNDTIR
ncbi:MAG: twin-arginine translocase TatA/TatE family subunit [Pseudonocardiaceae bacterium]